MMLDFYRGKRVFLTGHTGFKGMWLAKTLIMAGAEVTGYALPSATEDGARVLKELGLQHDMHSVIGDVRDIEFLNKVFLEAKPELVFHLAAQPLVLESYHDPVGTYTTNVLGTLNILECVRQSVKRGNLIRSVLNVTTDKVYENKEWVWGYRENEPLNGYDPYSNSKSCSELVTQCYQRSFFQNQGMAVSTARAGNVIGGGDFSANRILPDAIAAVTKGDVINVRNPHSIRPYQYVLEPLSAYLMITQKQYEDLELASAYNVGPNEEDYVTTGKLMDIFCEVWGNGVTWTSHAIEQPHEANTLKLDCSKIRNTLGWKPKWNIREAISNTIAWVLMDMQGEGRSCMELQIKDYFKV